MAGDWDWDEDDYFGTICIVGPAIFFFGTFIMWFLVSLIKLLLGE